MLKLTMSTIFKHELIYYDPNFYKFTKVYENEKDQGVSLATEYQRVLYLIYIGETKNNK